MTEIIPEGFGSTALNPRIESYADLVYRTKTLLGWPAAPVELTDAQWASIIDKAIEDFTEFEGNREEEYLVFCSNVYKKGCGVKLDDLLSVGCNTQHCYQTVVTETVTSTYISSYDIGTFTGYLSVTPFVYPTEYNYLDPFSVAFSGTSGQYFHLYFDPKKPWDASNVCQANCVTLNPVSSQYFQISSNPYLSSHEFDFVNDPILNTVLSSISSLVSADDYSSVPLSTLGVHVSAVPVSYYPLEYFYSSDYLVGPPVSACINIGKGSGTIYPDCELSNIISCAALSSQYDLSPDAEYIYTTQLLSSVNGLSAFELSSYTACDDVRYSCVTSLSSDLYNLDIYENIISGSNLIFNITGTDISSATHIKLFGVPSCTTDGSIPLDSNNGIIGTFTLCNTAFSTNGPMHIDKVQFFKDSKPPVEILYNSNCNWTNNGFTFSYYNSSYGECVRHTPTKVKVDINFKKGVEITEIGTISSLVSSNIDSLLNRKRKVLGVFNAENAGQGGYFGGGGDLLFNFDYALLANTFGYDLMGSRNMLGKQGYDLLTYHMARDFVDMSKKMLRYVTYQFNPRTQYLKITPEPAGATFDFETSCCDAQVMRAGNQCYVIGVYIEPSVQTILSTYFIKEYVLALAMITLGRIRSTYGGVTLYGGATLDGTQLLTKGEEKAEKLLAELRDEFRYSTPGGFYLG